MKVITNAIPPRSTGEEDVREAFEGLYYDHVDVLFQYGSKFRASQELIEDCVQELFADLWEKRQSLADIQSMRSYLLGALRRKILRRIYTSHEQLLDTEDMFAFLHQCQVEETAAPASPDEEACEQLTLALQQLTNRQQEVLYLRFYNQLSFQEIAEIMSVQTRAVYKLAHRSISTLKSYLSGSLHALKVLLLLLFS